MTTSRTRAFFGISFIALILFFNNCGNNSSGLPQQNLPLVAISANAPALNITGNESNVLAITVGCGYVNEPCVTVTICKPGTSQCVTINNILLDTGSYGLRIFSSLLAPLSLSQEQDSSGRSLAECQTYADGSADWGPVVLADVMMAGETASNIPMQAIDASFATPPASCTNLDTDPSTSQFNGILGVGHFIQDCGAGCAGLAHAGNEIYFNCAAGATNCVSTQVSLVQQVRNPVASFANDNNGVVVQLAAVAPAGAATSSGWLVFGIGTQASNTPPPGVVTFPADSSSGNFLTTFDSTNYPAFIDSGSNGLYFPTLSSDGLTVCTDVSGFFCPSSSTAPVFSATQMGVSGSPTQSVEFEVQDADIALNTSNNYFVLNNLAGPFTNEFDWGLPFFLGRTIYVGFEPSVSPPISSSPLGTGPYWAY